MKSRWVKPKYDEYGMTQWSWRVLHRENFVLGKRVQIGSFTVIDATKGVVIEDDVKIGWSCSILSYSSIDNKEGKVVLKRNSKIGANSVILPNVIVNKNAIVGANSLVNKDVPANEIWVGTPARKLRRIKK